MKQNSHINSFSPQTYSRVGGILYLIIIITGLFGELFVRNKLIVSGDATSTINNITGSLMLWRIGIAGDIFMHICDIPLVMIFYVLLKPINKNLALTALLFVMVQSAVMVAAKLNLFTPIFLSANADYLKAFDARQLQALSYVAVRTDRFGFGVGLIFFGCGCLIIGYLIIRSRYLPKAIGVLMQVAGLCYLINSFAMIIQPRFADMLFPFILLPSFIGELSFCIWMIVKGVNMNKWNEKLQMSAA
jgi:hypothetical protein